VLRIPAGAEREQLIQKLSGDQRVKLVQAMNGFAPRSQPYNDPYLAVQRGFQIIDAAGAQQWSRGDKVRVAVIDTGIDADHPDFGGRVVVSRNFVDRNSHQFGLDRHGTAVAGVISASANNSQGIVGIAPGVQIIALKACWQLDDQNDTAHCNSLTLAQALAAAISENAEIVNLSLAGPRDPLLNALVAAGSARGMIYVGASPVDAPADGFPGGTPGVIPVDMAESGAARSGVLRAPGREVVTLVPQGRYDFVSGSSLATAHVTGAVALLRARELGPGMADASPINACLALARLLERNLCSKAVAIPAAAAAASTQ
jgi:subtilisin family serine protease